MRFRLDGMPRDLPLSAGERLELRRRVRAWIPTDGWRLPKWVAMIPGGVMLTTLTLIWMPATWLIHSPWRYAVVAAAVLAQIPLTHFLMMRAMWKHTCRAMRKLGMRCARGASPAQRC